MAEAREGARGKGKRSRKKKMRRWRTEASNSDVDELMLCFFRVPEVKEEGVPVACQTAP